MKNKTYMLHVQCAISVVPAIFGRSVGRATKGHQGHFGHCSNQAGLIGQSDKEVPGGGVAHFIVNYHNWRWIGII